MNTERDHALKLLLLASFLPTLFFFPLAASAEVLDVPREYSTIGAALDDAEPGDVVKVAPGRYYEFGLKLTSGVILSGSGLGPEETIIDGQGQGRILTAKYLQTSAFVENLTFTNGHAQTDEGYGDSGGAILAHNGSLKIMDCVFRDNRADYSGGAIRCVRSSPWILNCLFENNWAQHGGGALDCSFQAAPVVQQATFRLNSSAYGGAVTCRADSAPYFSGCKFDLNTAEGDPGHGGAVLGFASAAPRFLDCTFSRNEANVGGAIFSDSQSPTHLDHCTLVSNGAQEFGPGIVTENASPDIKNSIIAFQTGIGVLSLGTELPRISCTNIYGNTQGDWFGALEPQGRMDGNLNVDPLFCETNLSDFYLFNLQEGSPCSIEGGACSDMGAWPVGCDFPTETYILDDLNVVWENGYPLVGWMIDLTRSPASFRLARSSLEKPQDEVDIPFIALETGGYTAQDTGFVPVDGQTTIYRLYLVFDDETEMLLDTAQLGDRPPSFGVTQLSAYPNPFNPQTRISFRLDADQKVAVELYGLDGRLVRSLASEVMPAGTRELVWNGKDNQGRNAASGAYVVLVKTARKSEQIKVMLLK